MVSALFTGGLAAPKPPPLATVVGETDKTAIALMALINGKFYPHGA